MSNLYNINLKKLNFQKLLSCCFFPPDTDPKLDKDEERRQNMKYDSSTGKLYEELGCSNNSANAAAGSNAGGTVPMDTTQVRIPEYLRLIGTLYFTTLGIFYDHFEYFMTIWYILSQFGIFFPRFGMLYQEKCGNPALYRRATAAPQVRFCSM
jgi:hypothetical protein